MLFALIRPKLLTETFPQFSFFSNLVLMSASLQLLPWCVIIL